MPPCYQRHFVRVPLVGPRAAGTTSAYAREIWVDAASGNDDNDGATEAALGELAWQDQTWAARRLCGYSGRGSGTPVNIAAIALLGAVGLGLLVIAIHIWLLVTAIETDAFVTTIKRLTHAGNRERVVRLCRAVGGQVADRQLVLFLFGLELPREVLLEGAPTGYRGSLPVVRFADRLRQLCAEQAPSFYRTTNRRGWAAVAAGIAATGLAAAAHVLGGRFGPPLAALGIADAPEHALLFGAAGMLVLTSLAGRRWRRTMAGQALVLGELVPLLRPVEDMLPSDRAGAAAARELLGESAARGSPRRAEPPGVPSAVGPEPTQEAPPVTGPAGRFCPNCGRSNEPHHRFCLGCGSELE